jgi:uncharacterized membrane protein YidH (DUF202 family)
MFDVRYCPGASPRRQIVVQEIKVRRLGVGKLFHGRRPRPLPPSNLTMSLVVTRRLAIIQRAMKWFTRKKSSHRARTHYPKKPNLFLVAIILALLVCAALVGLLVLL